MKKFVSIFLAAFTCLSISAFAACDETPPPGPGGTTYTVTEDEWRLNFNLTNRESATPASLTMGEAQAQTLACDETTLLAETTSLAEITSYTVHAEGEAYGTTGWALLKVAPNALESEFYVQDVLSEGESGKYANDTDFYIGLTKTLMMYFPFADYYDDFTYDETKKAYVCQNLISAQVDVYDYDDIFYVYTKTAEVAFENGYLKTISVTMCDDETWGEVMSTFVFTFSNINNTTVSL